jgi:ornithine cyclodeaminase/alanine dehydrogenase-like protein (mu-crystallin family)
MRTLLLGKQEVSEALNMKKCIDLCEKAYVLASEGHVQSFPRIWLRSEYGGLLGTAVVKEPGYLALKLLTRGVQVVLLVDYTKNNIVLMDGSFITGLRTGAAGVLSAKYLARKDSKTVGVLETGFVARHVLWALCETMKIESVKAYSRSSENRARYVKEMGEKLAVQINAAPSPAEAVKDADIIITGTKADKPVLQYEDVPPGAHIAAMGNQPEVDPKIFLRANVFTELLAQSKLEGKLSYAIKTGVIDESVVFPDLGDVITGKKPGRISPAEITLYDSQGLAAHDAVCAWEAYSQLSERGKGQWVDLDFQKEFPSY